MKRISKVTYKFGDQFWGTCSCCGRSIKHQYEVEGEKGHYGSSCVYKVAGITERKAKKEVATLNSREKTIRVDFLGKKGNKGIRGQFLKVMSDFDMTEKEVCEHYMRQGTFNAPVVWDDNKGKYVFDKSSLL